MFRFTVSLWYFWIIHFVANYAIKCAWSTACRVIPKFFRWMHELHTFRSIVFFNSFLIHLVRSRLHFVQLAICRTFGDFMLFSYAFNITAVEYVCCSTSWVLCLKSYLHTCCSPFYYIIFVYRAFHTCFRCTHDAHTTLWFINYLQRWRWKSVYCAWNSFSVSLSLVLARTKNCSLNQENCFSHGRNMWWEGLNIDCGGEIVHQRRHRERKNEQTSKEIVEFYENLDQS